MMRVAHAAATATATATAIAIVGCDAPSPERAPTPAPAPCERAYGDKLGVPFVRVCPVFDGAVSASFWIAAAPIGCTAGEHETIQCPPIVALGPLRRGATGIEPRTAQLINAEQAHRTCTLRFGGRLPTVAERAQATDAVGLATLLVTDDDAPNPTRHLDAIPEWTTAAPCLSPSTLAATCTAMQFPSDVTAIVAWQRARACRATPTQTDGVLVIGPQESCPVKPPPGGPPCAVMASKMATTAFALDCRPLRDAERIHPETTVELAAFRCVVPEGALTGTITN